MAAESSSPKTVLLMGNEAIARGALEAGVSYATGYPGNPSSEIVGTLLKERDKHGIRVEWSINEKVALESAAAFAFCGRSAMVTTKQNGMNVCADFLTTVSLNQLPGGLLVVVCDDPGPLTSTNEQDSRHFARIANIPLLEPASSQEAKEMVAFGLALSRAQGVPCILRTVSRLSHGRGAVRLGAVTTDTAEPIFDLGRPMVGLPFLVTPNHARLLALMKTIQSTTWTEAPYNTYFGPEDAPTLAIATGLGAGYATEAVQTLGLEAQIGILKLGTVWPLPDQLIRKHLAHATTVLFVEEVDPFMEEAVKTLYAEDAAQLGPIRFLGKREGAVAGPSGAGVGEMNTSIVLAALSSLFEKALPDGDEIPPALKAEAQQMLVPRELAFCPGCPHRASFMAIKSALALDARQGFVVGDIGCYGMAAGATGFQQIKALHCMGSGMGHASGFSHLRGFGFEQPVVAVAGDSTFFHAGLPALANAVNHRADAVFVILDNSVTAMTGFQGNPATDPQFYEGDQPIAIEAVAAAMGAAVQVLDPVADVQATGDSLLAAFDKKGVTVLVLRHPCAIYAGKALATTAAAKAVVDEARCTGQNCGCNRFCSRVLSCPAILFTADTGAATIERSLCTGCGLCEQICPRAAITIKQEAATV